MDAEVADQAAAWIADDVDPGDAQRLRELVAAAPSDPDAEAELTDAFTGTLQFGTAGLRGRLGVGPNRMNRAVVTRAAAGLMAYLLDQVGPHPVVVIGFDARHGSATFAADTADVVAAAGGRAVMLPGPAPTPVLAFAVRHLGADAGVMVTASHNPPQDNGYKVYLGGRASAPEGRGVQIVPPADEQIAAAIGAVASVAAVPRMASDVRAAGGSIEHAGEQIVSAYLSRLGERIGVVPDAADLRIVLTSMHGVGGALALTALRQAGFDDVTPVAEQADPDPEFPTVAFPNPEEAGALDLAIATAQRVGADLIIANDPDADRCSVAVPVGDGAWRQLTGDEIGGLLGEQVARDAGGDGTLASSVVSSRLLAAIGAAHGLDHRATLTGFKWIARVPGLVFGYEEAIGYCVDPDGVRDKDGINAAVSFARLAAGLKARGSSVPQQLDEMARRYGLYATAPLSVRVVDLSLIGTAMARLRQTPPAGLAGSPVTTAVDLATGSEQLPPTEGLLYLTEAGDRVIVRPSGTEPKIKCYLEVILDVAADADDGALTDLRRRAADRLAALSGDIAAAAGLEVR